MDVDISMEKMLDINFYRDAVLEILGGKHIARGVCTLRLNLFCRAAQSFFEEENQTNRELLEPFPSCFFDCTSKQRRYDDLSDCIASIPPLNEIKVNF